MLGHALATVDRVLFAVSTTNVRSRRALERVGAVSTNRREIRTMAGVGVECLLYEVRRKGPTGRRIRLRERRGRPGGPDGKRAQTSWIRSTLRDELVAALIPLVKGRLMILVGDVSESPLVSETLRMAGALDVRLLPLPAQLALKKGWTTAAQLAALHRFVSRPSRRIVLELDELDPAREGLVYAGSFVTGRSFGRRRLLGARTQQWFDAERKEVQAEWLASQVHVEVAVAPISSARTLSKSVSTALRTGALVLTGLPRGILELDTSHSFLIPRMVRGTAVLARNIRGLAQECWGVRQSRFLPGTPVTCYCYSIDGRIAHSGPFEAVSYVDWRSLRIRSVGILGSGLTMTSKQTQALRAVGMRFVESTNYEGAFCIDGVIAKGRFVAHEINPRLCSGHKQLDLYLDPPVPSALVDMAIRERLVTPTSHLGRELSRILRSLNRFPTVTSFGWLPDKTERLQVRRPADGTPARLARWRSDVLEGLRLESWSPMKTLGADGLPNSHKS